MKKYYICAILNLFYNMSLANCNFVIYNNDNKWNIQTRAEQKNGYAMAPLCSSLPEDYIEKWYKLFCAENTKFIPPLSKSQVIYAPYSTKDCYNIIGSEWVIKSSSNVYSKSYIIKESDIDITNNQNIFLDYKKFYN
jgi:hypothetical protein